MNASAPTTAIVVGAGVVGLSTAWYLQDHGLEVTVIDRSEVGAGASWGNAGWVTPEMVAPLADPHVWRHALGAFRKTSPLYIPPRFDPALWLFLTRFALRGNARAWERSLRLLAVLSRDAVTDFEDLRRGGVTTGLTASSIAIAFTSESSRDAFRAEMEHMTRAGLPSRVAPGSAWRDELPILSDRVVDVLSLERQYFLDPAKLTAALAESVTSRGGVLRTGVEVSRVNVGGRVELATGEQVAADHVVVAAGAWSRHLVRHLGVRTPLRAGRGYSFSVPLTDPLTRPIYFPEQRLACTPYGGRLRIAGTMEFDRPDRPPHAHRFDTIVASGRQVFDGVAFSQASEQWMGPRPITVDGLPLIGLTRDPSISVAAGHGMWGVVLAPVTARLLAGQIARSAPEARLSRFAPTR